MLHISRWRYLEYEVIEDRKYPGLWRVEAADHESEGECYVAIFSGPEAEARARDYAAMRADGRNAFLNA